MGPLIYQLVRHLFQWRIEKFEKGQLKARKVRHQGRQGGYVVFERASQWAADAKGRRPTGSPLPESATCLHTADAGAPLLM